MKRALKMLAVGLGLATVLYWAAKGMNTGWTKNRVEVTTPDEVTGLEKREWRETFVPGLDFLGGGLLVAGAMAGASRFIRKPTKQ